MKFKPKPLLHQGFFVPAKTARASELVPQPVVERPGGAMCRLDDLLGDGFAVLGWDDPRLRARAESLLPFRAPMRVVALCRADEDFAGSTPAAGVCLARDTSGALARFLDRLGAKAVIVRPDRYWWRVIAREKNEDGSRAER